MFELMLCSLFTILPDYLYRRYAQGKRFGHEITLYSVWYELRYGITSCLMLTVALITLILFFHPSTSNVTAFFRTVPILPETNGRVAEVNIGYTGVVAEGAQIFRLESTKQEAILNVAQRKIAEVDASMVMAKADIAAADAELRQAQSAYDQVEDELRTKEELQRRDPGIVPRREIEKLRTSLEGKQAGIAAATATKQAAETKLLTLLPAERKSAEAELQQAQVEIDKTIVRAGVSGRVEQFILRVGDVVNPFMRSAGVLVPTGSGREQLIAGFNQIEAPVIKVGMIAEAACASKPWKIIPMRVTNVQDYVAAGQVRASEQLVDPGQVSKPGTLAVTLQPLFDGGLEGVPPGSSCVANAYTSNHEKLADETMGFGKSVSLHVIDTLSLVHAMILRLQALVLPFKVLVLGGH